MRGRTFPLLSPIHKATRRIALHLAGPCGSEGVSPAEGHLLSYLRSYGPCPITALLGVFGHKPSTATSMLTRMVDRGLVFRESSAADRRLVLVGLTRRGAAAADRLRQSLTALEASIRSRVAERDVQGFRAVLGAIEDATRSRTDKESRS